MMNIFIFYRIIRCKWKEVHCSPEYTLGDYLTAADVSLLTNKPTFESSSASPDVIRLDERLTYLQNQIDV
jgi:hypothetical protein